MSVIPKGITYRNPRGKKNVFFGVVCSEQTIPIKSILLATIFLDQQTKSSISTWRERLLTRLYSTSNSLSLPTEVTLALLCWESWLIFCHDKQINNNTIICNLLKAGSFMDFLLIKLHVHNEDPHFFISNYSWFTTPVCLNKYCQEHKKF